MMIDHNAVSLFDEISTRYPMAAAGLIDDLCSKLSALLEIESRDEFAIANACETLTHIFRSMDRKPFPDSSSDPWDAAYGRFGRWLMRGLPQYRDALNAITGWSNEQMAACKTRSAEMIRIYRDDLNRTANDLENQIDE